MIPGATSATYTPVEGPDADPMTGLSALDADVVSDVGRYLVAVVSYTDAKQNVDMAPGDMARLVSANSVARDTRNRAPVFEDQDDDTPGTQNQSATREVAETAGTGDNVGNAVIAEDPDPNADPLTYALSGADAALFSVTDADLVDNQGGQITVKSGTKLDFETRTTYMVTLTATDSFGESASIDVTIMVTDVDEAPEISEGGLAITGVARMDYAENETGMVAMYTASGPDASMATWSLDGDDAGQFSIPNGMLMFMTAPDYEMPMDMGGDNMYMVTVMADDGTNMATQDVTVTVTNVDEMGTVTLSAMKPTVGMEIMATLADLDDGITGTTWQWASSSDMSTWADIEDDATSASYTPVEADANMYLRATAMYTDGEGSGKMASRMSAQQVTANTAPVFAAPTDERSVAENTAAGMDIGAPVAATDADDDTLTYTLGGDDMASFAINADTGQLMTMAALDFETKTSYSVTVTASDSEEEDTVMVTITVTNVGLDNAYDVDDDGMISRAEVLAAVSAYFKDEISESEVLAVVAKYFSDARASS